MSEQRGHYDPRPRHPNRTPADPEPLRELLRQYIEERHWGGDLLSAATSNGHGPDHSDNVRRRHG
jgi:hypothetical protein